MTTTPWLRARRYILGAIFTAGIAFFTWTIPSDGHIADFKDASIWFFLVAAVLLVIAGIYAAAKPSRAEREEMGQLDALEASHREEQAQISR